MKDCEIISPDVEEMDNFRYFVDNQNEPLKPLLIIFSDYRFSVIVTSNVFSYSAVFLPQIK